MTTLICFTTHNEIRYLIDETPHLKHANPRPKGKYRMGEELWHKLLSKIPDNTLVSHVISYSIWLGKGGKGIIESCPIPKRVMLISDFQWLNVTIPNGIPTELIKDNDGNWIIFYMLNKECYDYHSKLLRIRELRQVESHLKSNEVDNLLNGVEAELSKLKDSIEGNVWSNSEEK